MEREGVNEGCKFVKAFLKNCFVDKNAKREIIFFKLNNHQVKEQLSKESQFSNFEEKN
jgi:hypothetical protein